MKNTKTWFIIAFIVLICIGIGIYFLNRNKNSNNPNYSTSKVSTNEQQTNNYSSSENTYVSNTTNDISNNVILNNSTNANQEQKEEAIASFSTKIYNKDTARQNNIEITCSALNNTTVKNGEIFSFCNTIGPATSSKGYKEADIFDKDGNKKKGLGGGNCQVSSTLYNAVLKLPSLIVTERHEHSNKVPYISQGKDAAVAYGSYDLKFKNNSGFDIKISCSSTKNNVSVTIYKVNF